MNSIHFHTLDDSQRKGSILTDCSILGVASGVFDDFLRLTIVIAEYMFGNDLVFKKDGYDHCLGWKRKIYINF